MFSHEIHPSKLPKILSEILHVVTCSLAIEKLFECSFRASISYQICMLTGYFYPEPFSLVWHACVLLKFLPCSLKRMTYNRYFTVLCLRHHLSNQICIELEFDTDEPRLGELANVRTLLAQTIALHIAWIRTHYP